MKSALYGRLLLEKDLKAIDVGLLQCAKRITAMKISTDYVTCQRCGSSHLKQAVYLHSRAETPVYYCPTCIQLGRVQSDQYLYHLPEKNRFRYEKENSFLAWQGELTSAQTKVAQELCMTLENHKSHVVWAVTGAGKTEMLFPCIDKALLAGKRVAIAAPRVDVCLELYPRLRAAFPAIDIVLLHGGKTDPYQYSAFVICTTHQLLRFRHAFDLLIIDEVDSFPFTGNPMLAYGAKKAGKRKGKIIQLTATPTKEMKEKMLHNEFSSSLLPARFHRKPLPVPQLVWLWHASYAIQKQKIPHALTKRLLKQFRKKRRVLIICPNIIQMKSLSSILKKKYPIQKIEAVFASDKKRFEKIEKMRREEYDVLLSTTILERGVTFPGIDVWVFAAEHRVYTVQSLVQIAGRAGRSILDPYGQVFFFYEGATRNIRAAIYQIQAMNKKARKAGLID